MAKLKRMFAIAVSTALVLLTAGPGHAGTWQPDINTVYAMGPNDAYVAQWNGPQGQGWTQIGPAVAGSGVIPGPLGLFAVFWDRNIYEYNGTPGNWTLIGGPGDRFVQAAGHLFGLAPDDSYVAEWNGPGQGGWTIVGGAAWDITGGPAGLVETGSDGNQHLYGGVPGQWSQIGTDSTDTYFVGVTTIYRTLSTPTRDVQQWNGGQSWTTIGTQGSKVFANNQGVFKTNPSTWNIDRYDGTPGHWTVVGGSADEFATSLTDLYGLGPGRSYVARWNGLGKGWTIIGGPGEDVYAGE